jgi:hypothetical protein
MSIFGQLDAASIPTNPFFVEKGEYQAEVTKALYKENRDQQKQLHIEYTITDESSAFFQSRVPQYFNLVDPSMTQEMFELLPPDEKKKIRGHLSNLKRTLCGNDGNDKQKGLGVVPDDLNDANWDPAVLVGTKVILAVNNYGKDDQGVAVRWVNLPSEDE